MMNLIFLLGSTTEVTPPSLSFPTDAATAQTTGSGSVSTDEGNGTLYWVVTTSATSPTAAQVKAGLDHSGSAAVDSGSQAVTGTGAQNVSGGFSGLTAETQYYAHFMQEDAVGNQSAVSSADGFLTWGNELVTNGDFSASTGWTFGASWAYDAGNDEADKSIGSGDSVRRPITLVAGRTYRVSFTVKNFVAGGFQPRFTGGTQVDGTTRSANGTYVENLVALTGNNVINIVGFSDTQGSVDDVSVVRVA